MSETDGVKARLEQIAKDRATWAPGPWDAEPDREAFEAEGFPCIIQRGGGGAWCGYVGVPPGHVCHGKSFDSWEPEDRSPVDDLRVHGGITYSEACQGGICHVPKPGEPADVWWLGFDCNHSGDHAPIRAGDRFPPLRWDAYRTVDYVKAETRRLAAQLRAMVPSEEAVGA